MSPERIRSLRREGKLEQALELALELCARTADDAELSYEAACVHDSLGREAEAAPLYVRALELGLPDGPRRGAYLGLGSTYRALGRYADSLAVFDRALRDFPHAQELAVFRAMTLHNLERSKEALESLLGVIARTSDDAHVQALRRAIELYAKDLDRRWD